MKSAPSAPPTAWLATVVLLLLAAGCAETELPSAPDGPPLFSIFSFDTLTALPVPNASITAGAGSIPYRQRIIYQRSAEDMAQHPQTPVVLWMETRARGQWQGDLLFDFGFIEGQRGAMTLEGSFWMPRISPFCTGIEDVVSYNFVLTESSDVPDQGIAPVPRDAQFSRKEGFSETARVYPHAVVNTPDLTGRPCTITLEAIDTSKDRFVFRWGEPVWLWGQRLPEDEAPWLRFPGGAETRLGVAVSQGDDFESWDLALSWVPAGGQSGGIAVGYEFEPGVFSGTDYGADSRPFISVNEAAGDFFEPNDDFRFPARDLIAWGGGFFVVNPGLAIDEIDLQPDSSANPLGLSDWGRGDWWALDVPEAMDVCVQIEMAEGDDQDLFLFQDSTLLDFDVDAGDRTAFVFGTTTGATTLTAWVAPYTAGSDLRSYELYAYDCSIAGASARTASRTGVDPSGKLAGLGLRASGSGGEVAVTTRSGFRTRAAPARSILFRALEEGAPRPAPSTFDGLRTRVQRGLHAADRLRRDPEARGLREGPLRTPRLVPDGEPLRDPGGRR